MSNPKLSIDTSLCKGCALCKDACPKNILTIDQSMVNTRAYHPAKCIDQDKCTACAACAIICPDSAIRVEREIR